MYSECEPFLEWPATEFLRTLLLSKVEDLLIIRPKSLR